MGEFVKLVIINAQRLQYALFVSYKRMHIVSSSPMEPLSRDKAVKA